jgi:tetratricopeptide (TPR) repeat protein
VADNPLILRPLLAMDAVSFYLWKLCWPLGLCPDYGRRPTVVINQGDIEWTWAIPLALGWLIWSIGRRRQIILAASAIFVAGLLPTLGFVPFIFQRNSSVSDRYVYVAMLGPAIVLGWCCCQYARARVPVLFLIGAMTILSIRQEALWTDSLHLFAHSVEVSPTAPFNHLNYGAALAADGRLEEAAEQFRQTLALAPQNVQARDNLNQAMRLMAAASGAR